MNQIASDLGNAPSSDGDSLLDEGSWHPSYSAADAICGTDAVLILTEWHQFKNLPWAELALSMRKPAWLFDARAVVEPKQAREAGLRLWRVGDAS